jgi:transcriptional antiterminator NusG
MTLEEPPEKQDDTATEGGEPRPEEPSAPAPEGEPRPEEPAAPASEAEEPRPQEPSAPASEAEEPSSADASSSVEPDATESDVAEPEEGEPGVVEAFEPVEPEAAEAEEGLTTEVPAPAEAAEAGTPPEEAPVVAEAAEEVVVPDGDPFGGPGDWYVIHTYAGYENKVKTNLESRIHTMQMEEKIFDVVIPMEDVMEIKGGKKQVVQKKVFPGYLLVKMVYDDDSWYVVRNTPGVTGFVSSGTGQKPTPLSRREVEKILAVKKEEVKPAFRLDFEEGDVVRIISGPFADFNGTISDINVDQSKVRVMVNIFDRETPVELSFDQVARV